MNHKINISTKTELNLTALNIDSIDSGSFDNFTNVERLILNNNKLTTRSLKANDTFRGLETTLKAIYLDDNSLVTLDQSMSLFNLTMLKNLHLSRNKLSSIDDNTFQALFYLEVCDLSHNELVTIPGELFRGLVSLKEIRLNNNKLKTLESQTFAELKKLRRLDLEFNRLQTIESNTFAHLSSLMLLTLNNNVLDSIEQGTFTGLAALFTLKLNSNKLSLLTNGSLDGMPVLKELYLYENVLEHVPPFPRTLNRVTRLALDTNLITVLRRDSFR